MELDFFWFCFVFFCLCRQRSLVLHVQFLYKTLKQWDKEQDRNGLSVLVLRAIVQVLDLSPKSHYSCIIDRVYFRRNCTHFSNN